MLDYKFIKDSRNELSGGYKDEGRKERKKGID